MKRLIYLKNGQSLNLLVSALNKSRPRYISAPPPPKKKSSPIYLDPKNLLCNRINWVGRIKEQRKLIKNNEEKNPKLLFVHVHVHIYGVFNLCQHFEISYSRYASKHYITGVYIAINDIYR
jgi:hypothetical protein